MLKVMLFAAVVACASRFGRPRKAYPTLPRSLPRPTAAKPTARLTDGATRSNYSASPGYDLV